MILINQISDTEAHVAGCSRDMEVLRIPSSLVDIRLSRVWLA